MIHIKFREGAFEATQSASLGNIELTRAIGRVVYRNADDSFGAMAPGIGLIASVHSLPAAIHELIDFHKLTDYQYAPWPKEEDEGEE